MQEVQGTIDWAKDKLSSFPKAKKNLGPLLDALGRKSSIIEKPSVIDILYRASDSNCWRSCIAPDWRIEPAWQTCK